MNTTKQRVLVAGASGQLGTIVTRRLLEAGYPVRALARNAARLRPLGEAGAECVAADLTDGGATRAALAGVHQIVSTANNVLGSGATSPHRVDLAAYRTLTSAAREGGVRRLIHVSALHIGPDSVVDFFRVKHAVDGVIRSSGVPYVLLHFAAFMDVWSAVVLGDGARPTAATLFGGGRRRMNFIAIEDVSRFVLAVVGDERVVNETIDIGGPSDASLAEMAALAESALGAPLKRRAVPAPVLRVVRLAARPVSERVARMVSLGYWTTLADRPFGGWEAAARRFGITPCTLEDFLNRRYGTR